MKDIVGMRGKVVVEKKNTNDIFKIQNINMCVQEMSRFEREDQTMMEVQDELMVEVDMAVYKKNIFKKRPQDGPERQSLRSNSTDKFSQVELHEGGAGVEKAVQGGADSQADEAVGDIADEASLCILQKTAINDKNNLRSDYLAQDMIFNRLNVSKQNVQPDHFKLQEGAVVKYREMQENINIVSREYRYNCMENNAVQGQEDEAGGDAEVEGPLGGAHSAGEEAVGGQHEQGFSEVGVVDDERVGVHVVRWGQEGSHNPDGGPGGPSEEGAGEGRDDQEHGHEVCHGGVRRGGQLGEEDGEQQEDSQVKRRKKRAKKQILGVEPGLVQLKISQFIFQFPNLKKGGPMMRLNFEGESNSTGIKREVQSKRKRDQVEGPVIQHTKRIRHHSTGTSR